MPTWDADLYLQFADERTRPSHDLIARVALENPQRVIDLGCGPGNSTALLRKRWPEARTLGLDNSHEMLTAALQAFPEEKWVQGDIATWQAKTPFDLVFSNAALQWVPDHAALLPRLFSSVAEGGALAVQMPANNDTPLRQIAFEIADNVSWRHLMQPALSALTEESPSLYYDALQPVATRLDIWRTEYVHVMDSPRAIVDWYRGTGLRPFLEALKSDAQRESFLKLLLSEYTRTFPRQRDGKVLFPFWRLFVVAYK